jgi:hypothetical protein
MGVTPGVILKVETANALAAENKKMINVILALSFGKKSI